MRTQSESLRSAIITGGTDGIGKAAARSLTARGWDVTVIGRDAGRCAATAEELGVRAVVADLSCMADVRRAAGEIAAPRIDALILNANAITQARALTDEGFERNLAVGHLGRALLYRRLQDRLVDGQVLSVVGLDHQRIDLADPHQERGYTARKALMRWQWAAHVYVEELTRRGVRANMYMPGLVRTKILANEPQPMRLFVQVMNALIGIPVEQGGEEMAKVVEEIAATDARGAMYSRTRRKPPRDVGASPADGAAVWEWTERTIASWTG